MVALTDVAGVRPAPVLLVAVGYAAIAILARVVTGGEIYPFFTWDLFSRIPAEQLRPTLYLEGVGQQPFATPVPLFESRYSRGNEINGSKLTGALVSALRDDADEQARLLAALRRQHLPSEATWAVVWERYDPIERVQGVPPATFEAARFGPADAPVPDDHRLDRAGGVVVGPDRRWQLTDAPTGAVTSVTAWDDGGLRVSGWAGDPETGALPQRLVLFSGERPIAYLGVGANGAVAVEATGNEDLDRAGFTRVVPAEHVPAELGPLTVVALYADGTARELTPAAP